MTKKRIILMLTVLLAALALSGCSFITTDGRVFFGESFALPNSQDGEVLNESVVVFGGNVDIEEDAKVIGDVVVFGGNVDMAGEVTRNLVLFGGDLELAGSALVRQDLVTIGSVVDRAGGSQVRGQVISEIPEFESREFWQPNAFNYSFNTWANYGAGQVLEYMLNTLAFTALAVLAALFLPKQMKTVATATSLQPLMAGGMGCLTFLAVPIIAVLMVLTLVLIPISPLVLFLLVIAAVFGWVALGLNIGQRMAEALNQDWTPIVAAGVGTFTLEIVTGGIGFIPCIGVIVTLAIASIGLGAVVMTRFGTQLPISMGGSSDDGPAALPEPAPEPEPAPPAKPKSQAKTKAKPKSKTAKAKSTKKKE